MDRQELLSRWREVDAEAKRLWQEIVEAGLVVQALWPPQKDLSKSSGRPFSSTVSTEEEERAFFAAVKRTPKGVKKDREDVVQVDLSSISTEGFV